MAVIFLKFVDVIPVRFNLWIMIFTSCWVAYMMRVNMSINLIAMVPPTARTSVSSSQCGSGAVSALKNDTLENNFNMNVSEVREGNEAKEIPGGGSFNWTGKIQGLILGSYFWCYPVTSLVGGMAAERWGPRYVILVTSLASAILTMITPAAARLHYIAVVGIRFFLGVAGGFTYPALHVLVARWAPPAEKGKFMSALMGGILGTVVTWSVSGPLIEKCGWSSAFYLPACLTFVWCGLWWYLVADTPTDHPRISEAEKKYILDALGDKVKTSKGFPPIRHIVTSVPFLAMIVLHYGNMWGLYFVMTVGPKFISTVLGFELATAGVVSALPYLARLVLAAIFGALGDYIVLKKLMNTTNIRKFFTLFSHVIPGILLVLLVYAGCSATLAVTLITLSMGVNGATTLTNLQNHQDLAPNYAGTLYGIANAVGSTAGFVTPMITIYFTKNGNGFEQWRPVFYLGAAVYIVSAIFFLFLGTSNTQHWNFPKEDEANDKHDKKKNDKREDLTETQLSVI